MQALRWFLPTLTAVAALLPSTALPTAADDSYRVTGIEYSATATTGRFSGLASGPLPAAWDATVIHDQLQRGTAVPITGGTVTLNTRAPITGTFANGTVSPINTPTTCADERFNVTGSLAFDKGRTGTFTVVLTHLRTELHSGCVTFGAIVIGTLTLTAAANT